jgi:hypothetical protein
MLVSPIFGVLALGGHDCLDSEFLVLPPTQTPVDLESGLEFGFKGDTNSVSGRAEKHKCAVPEEQLIYYE